MRFANKAVLAAGLGFTVSAVVGCGSGGNLLSSDQASQLQSQLNLAQAALSEGACSRAESDISNFQNQVDELGSVNQTLVNNLQAGANKIERLATTECAGGTSSTPPPAKTTPKTTPVRTTPQRTTPTVTTVTETQPTTSSPVTTSTSTDTSPDQTTTGSTTSSTSTDTAPPPGTGLTGSTTSSTPTSPTQSTTPSSGGSGLNGGAVENSQRRGFDGSQLPQGWQRHQQYPGANGWHGDHGGWQHQGEAS